MGQYSFKVIQGILATAVFLALFIPITEMSAQKNKISLEDATQLKEKLEQERIAEKEETKEETQEQIQQQEYREHQHIEDVENAKIQAEEKKQSGEIDEMLDIYENIYYATRFRDDFITFAQNALDFDRKDLIHNVLNDYLFSNPDDDEIRDRFSNI